MLMLKKTAETFAVDLKIEGELLLPGKSKKDRQNIETMSDELKENIMAAVYGNVDFLEHAGIQSVTARLVRFPPENVSEEPANKATATPTKRRGRPKKNLEPEKTGTAEAEDEAPGTPVSSHKFTLVEITVDNNTGTEAYNALKSIADDLRLAKWEFSVFNIHVPENKTKTGRGKAKDAPVCDHADLSGDASMEAPSEGRFRPEKPMHILGLKQRGLIL